MRRRRLGLVPALACAALAASAGVGGSRAADDPCVRIPTGGPPLWIEYGEGSVPPAVRDVLARPGVTIAASGTFLPTQYRARGVRTTYWVLKLPSLVGDPGKPADAAAVTAAADRVYRLAVKSTLCATPIVALNELAAPGAPVPWSDGVRAYRANVLALMRRLAEQGAVPVLLIHGNPVLTGESVGWWREVGATGHVVYEAYYRAPTIAGLGRIVGPRRLRLGMRSIVRAIAATGVPRARIGLILGFQSAPGKAGREGLQPSAAWFRYVKWNALAARQVALEERLPTIWSWGWGALGPNAADPDKPAAACVYLWARDQALCDGKTAAGPGFVPSLVEGPIVIAGAVQCLSVAGKLPRATVAAHATPLRSLDEALSATFARQVLRKAVPVPASDVVAAEEAMIARAFAGSRDAYLAELARRGLTLALARGILEDGLRRERIGAVASPVVPLAWIADRVSAALDTATCRGDRLPGAGDFPTTDRRETAGSAVGRLAPFLLDDAAPPAPPSGGAADTVAPTTVQLTWQDGPEADLVGYLVFRLAADGTETQLNSQPWPRSRFVVRGAAPGAGYVARAVDLAGNLSLPSDPLIPGSANPPIPGFAQEPVPSG